MTYERGCVRYGKRRPGERGEESARVCHDVADDVDSPEDTFGPERSPRAVVGAEQEPGEAIGLDPVVLLRHREVAASQPGLDVRERDRRVRCRPRSRKRRVRVAVDEDDVRRLRGDPLGDRGLHLLDVRGVEIEAIARFAQAELVEEDLGHDVIPVLPRVEHDLVDPRIAQGRRERRGLDELRAVPDDGEDLHATKPTNETGLRPVSPLRVATRTRFAREFAYRVARMPKSSDKPKKQQKQKPQKTLKERRSEKRAAKKLSSGSLLPADK